MRTLLFILLFPIFSHAQFAAGLANYCSETAIKFGVLVQSSTLGNSAKADIAKDSLGCKWVRTTIRIDTWNGQSNLFEAYAAKGIKQLVNIQYNSGLESPFPTAGQLAGYADTLALILTKYPTIVGIVIENEAINETFHEGPLSDYVAEVQTAYGVAHTRNIKVVESGVYGTGLHINVYRWLLTIPGYGSAAATQYGTGTMTTAQINAAITPNSNPAMEAKAKQIDTIFTAKNYLDWFNIHPYEPYSPNNLQPDTVTQITPNVLRFQKEYVEKTTLRPCVSNETGQRDNDSPTLVTNSVAEYYRLGFFQMQWFDGVGALAGAVPLTDETTGVVFPNGTAFKAYVITHQNGGTALP